jgi:PiT family inorganic phosphate transporter
MVTYIVIIIVIALLFDFGNGMNDAANSIATVVTTRVLPPRLAVLWAAFFNFIAAFGFKTAVAKTIGRDVIDPAIVDPNLIFATLLAAIVWTFVCTHRGLPISVSHALIGAMAGAAVMKAGVAALNLRTIGVIAAFIVLSPLVGMLLGSSLMVVTSWLCRRSKPRSVDGVFRILQLMSAAVYSLSHGLNDAQKTMGIISALLLSAPGMAYLATHDGDPNSDHLAWWIILSCHAAIALGTYTGGWRVIKTLGHRVTRLQPQGGFCAETGGGVTVIGLSVLGIPVSTTHTITGAIFGVGIVRRLSAVRWTVGYNIMTAWVLTLPTSAAMAAVMYKVVAAVAQAVR